MLAVATPRTSQDPTDGGAPSVPSDDAVERALGVPTRANIYRRLRTEGVPASAREVAEMFGLHPNVARNHLDQLAEAGLLVTSRRKHPGGGRPARVYVAREQAVTARDAQVPPGSQLGVHVVVQLIAGLTEHEAKLELLAEEHGRRLVAAAAGRADARDFEAAAVVAIEALRRRVPRGPAGQPAGRPGRRRGPRGRPAPDRRGRRGGRRRAGPGVPARGARGGRRPGRPSPPAPVACRPSWTKAGSARRPAPATAWTPAAGPTSRAWSPRCVRWCGLRPGDHLEVLTDLQGAPAAFARWADRAGHEIVDVTRIRDVKGKQAVRLLLRKDTGLLAGPASQD